MRLEEIIPPAYVPEGYRGKIMLILVHRGSQKHTILRSGDLWHYEILRNAEAEIQALGLQDVLVEELGGAHLSFRDDGSIIIWGKSDYFGACDREYAAELVRTLWPDRKVTVSDHIYDG